MQDSRISMNLKTLKELLIKIDRVSRRNAVNLAAEYIEKCEIATYQNFSKLFDIISS